MDMLKDHHRLLRNTNDTGGVIFFNPASKKLATILLNLLRLYWYCNYIRPAVD